MSQPKRFQKQSEDLPAELVELGELLQKLETENSAVHDELIVSYNRVAESVLRRRRILNLVQEALSQLRLDVKYLMFDLEMTRRERDELQARIEGEERGF
ncbi:MAG: transcriptional regulator [Planctomycetaceae bacterium]